MDFSSDFVGCVPLPFGRTSRTWVASDVKDGGRRVVLQTAPAGQEWQIEKKCNVYRLCSSADLPVPTTELRRNGAMPYLRMELLEGKSWNDVATSASLRRGAFSAAATILVRLHEAVPVRRHFGWIQRDLNDPRFDSMQEYIESDSRRIARQMAPIDADLERRYQRDLGNLRDALGSRAHRPALAWYDVRPENILLRGDGDALTVSGWLDPGAARAGVAEWDLAHAFEHLCESDEDREVLFTVYGAYSASPPDRHLTEALRRFVLWDDLALAAQRQWPWLMKLASARLAGC